MRLCEPRTTTSERSYPMLPFCPCCIEAVAQPLRLAISIVDPRSTAVKRLNIFPYRGPVRPVTSRVPLVQGRSDGCPRALLLELAQHRGQLGHPGLVLPQVAE